MHKEITLFGIATAIVILAVCIGAATAGGTAVAGMANVDASTPHTAANSGTPTPAYTNNDTIWLASGNQLIGEDTLTGIAAGTTPTHSATHFYFTMAPSNFVNLITPFVNTISKNGIHPKVRYLYYELKMPKGVNVTYIYVNSGATNVYFGPVTWAGTGGVKDYTLDMGSYHYMAKGIYTGMLILNSKASKQAVGTYGAGVKEEW